jgi:hypothetical protein
MVAQRANAKTVTMSAGLQLASAYRPNCWQRIRLEFRNESSTAIEGSLWLPEADRVAPDAGVKQVSIDCGEGDYDADRRVWLLLDIHPEAAGGGGGGNLVGWRIRELGLAFDDVEAVAPPKPVILDPSPRSSEKGR